MPFKSEAQRRLFHWAANNPSEAKKKKGIEGITKGKARQWEKETGSKDLPEKVKKKAAEFRFLFRKAYLDGKT